MTPTRMIAIALAAFSLAACGPADDTFVPIDTTGAQSDPEVAVESPGEPATLNPSGQTPDIVQPAGDALGYLVFLPEGYKPDRPAPYPLFIMLHGAGPENVSLEMFATLPILPPIFVHRSADYPFVVLMPHLGQNVTWVDSVAAMSATLDAVEQAYNVDPTRVFLTGFSAGGAGVLAWGLAEPDRFAALVSVAGYWPYDEDPTTGDQACPLVDVPTWLVQSIADTIVTINDFQVVRLAYVGCGGQPEARLLESASHQETFSQAYSDVALYDWLLEQSH